MHDVWPTIVGPMIAALRPAVTIDFGSGDARLGLLIDEAVAGWGGAVHAIDASAVVLDGASPRPFALADLALVSGAENWWTVHRVVELLAHAAQAVDRPLPVILVDGVDPPWGRRDRYRDPDTIPPHARQPLRRDGEHWVAVDSGTPRNGVLTALEDFAGDRPELDLLAVPGLGGTAIVSDRRRDAPSGRAVVALLERLRLPPGAAAQIALVDARRLREAARAEEAEALVAAAAGLEEERDQLAAERAELAATLERLAERLAAQRARALAAEIRAELAPQSSMRALGGGVEPAGRPPADHPAVPAEPTRAGVAALLRPAEMLTALGWPGPEGDLGGPLPVDRRGIVDPQAAWRLTVLAGSDRLALARTICSVLDRASVQVALSLVIGADPDPQLRELTGWIARTVPGIELARGEGPGPELLRANRDGPGSELVLRAGDELPRGWPELQPVASAPSVAYLLPGLPPEGSGGSHSVVAEARGLRALGAQTRVCVPASALAAAVALYGNGDQLFRAYSAPARIAEAAGPVDVAVATEHPSVALLERLVSMRPHVLPAYYVQDYEPLFGPTASGRSDQALLSYRAIPDQLLFAKSEWLRNVVSARHRVAVAKVEASLDAEVFHDRGRPDDQDRPVRVVAMVRPRTPRRRPEATLRTLELVRRAGGDEVQTLVFGCDHDSFERLATAVGAQAWHLGVLDRGDVGELLRRCDVFLDASAYQAFGRTGLEAMACGAVPVLPSLGGVGEYATHERDALLMDDDRPEALAAAVMRLVGDPEGRARMRAAGTAVARRYTVRGAATSQLELFAAATRSRWPSAAATR